MEICRYGSCPCAHHNLRAGICSTGNITTADQAIVPGLVPGARRTWGLAWYNVLLDGGGSLGALGAGLPPLLQHQMSFTILTSYRLVFVGYSILCVVVAAIYLCLSPAIEVGSSRNVPSVRTAITPKIAQMQLPWSLSLPPTRNLYGSQRLTKSSHSLT